MDRVAISAFNRKIGWQFAAAALVVAAPFPARSADRDQPRIVVNLVGAIKAPF